MNHKIPYLIDSKRISYEIISKFLEKQPEKTIIKTNYNDINEIGDMFDKIETSMKNGNELFIDQCEEAQTFLVASVSPRKENIM